jgi:hypothetical protein
MKQFAERVPKKCHAILEAGRSFRPREILNLHTAGLTPIAS